MKSMLKRRSMGITHVTVEVKKITGKGKGYRAQFLVDTGAIHCMAPASKLKAAGIKPKGKGAYELADATSVEFEYGYAQITFMGSETVSQIIFGPENCEPILGVLALEST